MIAAVRTDRGLCIVWETKKTSLVSVTTKTYCTIEVPAANGVIQVPDDTLFCAECEKNLAALRIPRKPK